MSFAMFNTAPKANFTIQFSNAISLTSFHTDQAQLVHANEDVNLKQVEPIAKG